MGGVAAAARRAQPDQQVRDQVRDQELRTQANDRRLVYDRGPVQSPEFGYHATDYYGAMPDSWDSPYGQFMLQGGFDPMRANPISYAARQQQQQQAQFTGGGKHGGQPISGRGGRGGRGGQPMGGYGGGYGGQPMGGYGGGW